MKSPPLSPKRKKTSVTIAPHIWESFKIYCIKKNIDMSAHLEAMIRKEVRAS